MSEVTKEITGTKTKEIKENEKSPCLYLSPARKSGYSPSIILTKLESLGFIVNQESSTTVAANLCFSIRMALIVLEDCEEKAFIEAIKSPKSCNEHTPIVFISSGPLSDVVRDLIQEQFIDELVFKCLTLECDLGSAVARLIRQPGQFAVTPKTKRPAIASKRTFQGSFPYLKKTCLGKSSTGEQDSAENLQGHAWNSHPCRASTAVKSENAEPSINGEHINLDSVIHCSGETDAGPKRDNGLSTKGKTVKLDNNALGMGSAASLVSLSLGRKNHNYIWMTASQKSSSAACSTALERKEQHLDKEKKRRERITKSWCWLRQLMPNCDSYADKATVFEMSVAYLHHCWKYHCSILQQVNEEFVLLNTNNVLSEDMERKVIQVLEKERKVIGCLVESSTG